MPYLAQHLRNMHSMEQLQRRSLIMSKDNLITKFDK